MKEILAPYPGVQLLEAMQGKLGLDLAQTHAPDWILLDLHLPDMSGEDVLQSLRRDPRTERIPVTVLSADATPSQINRLKAKGARDYLTKPLDVRQMIALLEDTLRREAPGEPPVSEQTLAVDQQPLSVQAGTAVRWSPEAVTFTALPAELLQQLLSAVLDGEKDRLDELIAAVAKQDSQSAVALKELADTYEYDALTNLLTEASKCSEASK
jgi:DNA-binding response OmpR family regulator